MNQRDIPDSQNKLSWSAKSDPAQARKELGDLLLQAEATVPWLETGETKADKAWGKFLRIRDWMKELIQEFPSGEAVRGNIDNLDKIWNERGAMETVKAMEIIRAQQLLNKLLPIVEGWTADDPFRVVSGLVTVPVGDANFDIHQATLRVIRYALLFIPEDGNKTRIGRLQARLARLESEEEETGEILAEEK